MILGLLTPLLLTVGQQPVQANSRLDAHLAAWEQAAAKVVRFRTEFSLTRTEAVFKKKREYTGAVTLMKPNLVRLRLASKKDPTDWEEYICDGKSIYAYNGSAKTITEFKLGSSILTPLDDSPVMAMLGGMTAADVQKRFDVSLLPEDANYVYLRIRPTLPKDKQEFEEAVLALFAPKVSAPGRSYLPALIQVRKPNGDMESWLLHDQVVNPKVEESAFKPRDEPGFTRKEMPQRLLPPAPTVPKK